MTTTDKPEIPLTEAIAPALAFARQSLDVGAMAAFNAVLAIAPSYDAMIRQQEARIAELEAALSKFRELAREASITLPDLKDEEFRAECMARLGKASKALIEDASTLLMRLAAVPEIPEES